MIEKKVEISESFVDGKGNIVSGGEGLLKELEELHRKEREFPVSRGVNSCPECKEGYLVFQSGCKVCYDCGYSPCK